MDQPIGAYQTVCCVLAMALDIGGGAGGGAGGGGSGVGGLGGGGTSHGAELSAPFKSRR